MTLAGLAFVGYAVVFLASNFTGAFLELGIGPDQVDKGKAEVEAFSPELYHYISRLHIALSGFIAAIGLAITALSWYGVRRGVRWAFASAVIVPPSGSQLPSPHITRGAWPRWDFSARSTSLCSFSSQVSRQPTAECETLR